MIKKTLRIVIYAVAIIAVAMLAALMVYQHQKQALKPLLKPYLTAKIPDYGNIPLYQTLSDPRAHESLPVVGLNVDPEFNGQLSDPKSLKNLSDFIALNVAFMESVPRQLNAANPATIVNNSKNIKEIENSLSKPALMSRFYHIKLEYDIAANNQAAAFDDLKMIHRCLIELVKFPYVFAHHYFSITVYRETAAVSRIVNCFKLTPQELSEITVMLNQTEALLPQSFNNAISCAVYFLLFAPMAERQIAFTNRDYPLTYHRPDDFPVKSSDYSLKELWQREHFFMKYLAFVNTGLFDFANYRKVEKGWEQYQKDFKECPTRKYMQKDIDLFEVYQGCLYSIVQLRFAKIAVAVRLFEVKNQRPPVSLEEMIKQNLITAADTVNPFTGEVIQFEQGVFPVLQEYRYIDNRNQDRYEDYPTIRLSCPTLQRTLQYFVVNIIK